MIGNRFPTSRPTLNLNFARTKRLDPRVTFSRASSATYYDQNGVMKVVPSNRPRFDHNPSTEESLGLLIEEARTNRFGYSAVPQRNINGLSSCRFQENYALAPDGTFTANRWRPIDGLIDPGGSSINVRFYKSISVVAGDTITQSIFVKPIQVISRYPNPPDTTEADRDLHIALEANQGGSAYLNLRTLIPTDNSTVTAIGDGWYRFSRTYTASSTSATENQFVLLTNRTTSSFDPYPTGNEEVLIWGFQVETGFFPTSYIPTPATFTGRTSSATYYDASGVIQTAGSGVARNNAFFPDSSGIFRPVGLLLEGAGTNLITQSNSLSSFSYTTHTLTQNATTSPDGTINASRITSQGGGSAYIFITTSSISTFSVYLKTDSVSWVYVDITGGGSTWFNLQTGQKGSGSGNIQNVGNGWYRVSVYTISTGSIQIQFFPTIADGSFDRTSGNSIFCWGAQLETSTYPTSYIPTTTSTVTRSEDTSTSPMVTRSADVAQITGTNFSSWYNQTTGTIFIESRPMQLASNANIIKLRETSVLYNNIMAFIATSGSNQYYVSALGSTIAGFNSIAPYSISQFNKTIGGYSLNNFNAAVNGSVGIVDTSGNTPVNIDGLGFGAALAQPGEGNSNLIIRQFIYWPTRLPDATLQALTR